MRSAQGPWSRIRKTARTDCRRAPLPQRRGVQPEPGGRAPRARFCDEDVGTGEQSLQDVPSLGRLQVQGQGLLGAVEPYEVAGLAVHGGVVATGEVAASRALHLDHPGAEVGQLTGGVGRRHRLLDADDGDAGERKRFGELGHGATSRGWPGDRGAAAVMPSSSLMETSVK